MDEKKEIGSESDTKSGAGKEIMGALSQFDQLMVLLLFRKKKTLMVLLDCSRLFLSFM